MKTPGAYEGPTEDEHDDFMPRERGLLSGEIFARSCRENGITARDGDGNEIDPVAAAAQNPPHIAEATRHKIMDDGGMQERLAASDDPDAEGAFWAGFRDGVRAYLVRVRTGTDN